MEQPRARVVIVGAGFAGLQCARALARSPVSVALAFKLAVDAFFQAIARKGRARADGTPRLLKPTVAPTVVLGRGYLGLGGSRPADRLPFPPRTPRRGKVSGILRAGAYHSSWTG
jgi:hypothetical protein